MACHTIVAAVPRWLWLKMNWPQNWLLWWSPKSQQINPAAALKCCSHIYLPIRFVAMVCNYIFCIYMQQYILYTYIYIYIYIYLNLHISHVCIQTFICTVYFMKFWSVSGTLLHHVVATFASSRAFCWSPKPGEEPGKIITTSSSGLG